MGHYKTHFYVFSVISNLTRLSYDVEVFKRRLLGKLNYLMCIINNLVMYKTHYDIKT